MFNLLGKGDLAVRKIMPKNVFLFGLKKAGTSTVFNYMSPNIKLIGVKSGLKKLVYNVQNPDPDVAGADTLIPNIMRIENQYSISDMASFSKRRYT